MFGADENDEQEKEEVLEQWVQIQMQTFTNWVNDSLRRLDLKVESLRDDFKDGVLLCKLTECLLGRGIGKIIQKKHINHYEASGNLALALRTLAEDGVNLTNTGAEDIAGRNTKIILGLVWKLIRKYQLKDVGKGGGNSKKMMLHWINAVLHPHMTINNFSEDWIDGRALSGIIEYCRPGTFPNWTALSRNDRLANCEQAINTANSELEIPIMISPENFSSASLDELSVMTYLSYYMDDKTPGFKATLEWVKDTIQPAAVNNFSTDWNTGYVATHLVRKLGGIPPEQVQDHEAACNNAIEASERQFNIPHVISGKEMTSTTAHSIGIMAYAAWHRTVDPMAQHAAPAPAPEPTYASIPHKTPTVPGDCFANVKSCVRVNLEAAVNVGSPSTPGAIMARARSPQNVIKQLDRPDLMDGCGQIPFKPDVVGEWQIEVTYNDMDIPSSPLFVNVFDPNLATLIRDNGYLAYVNQPYSFQVDSEQCGSDNITCSVVHEDSDVTVSSTVTKVAPHKFDIDFKPTLLGFYNISVFCEDIEIPGSPFRMEVLPDPADIYVHGPGIESGIKQKECTFTVDADTGIDNLLLVTVQPPSGKAVLADVSSTSTHYQVKYMPLEVGDHILDIKYNSVDVPGSPFTVPIRNGKVYVKNLNNPVIYQNKEQFELDASEMVKGEIEIDSVFGKCEAKKLGHNLYNVCFVPNKLGNHDMIIKYNNMEIDGNPFMLEVVRR